MTTAAKRQGRDAL